MNEGFARPVTDEVVKPTFFATADAFRRWLEANHRSVNELWIGFYKAHTGGERLGMLSGNGTRRPKA